jgi:hypothetical protein
MSLCQADWDRLQERCDKAEAEVERLEGEIVYLRVVASEALKREEAWKREMDAAHDQRLIMANKLMMINKEGGND